MAVSVRVTNHGKRVIGRLNRVFEPSKPVQIRCSAWRLPEVASAPTLRVELLDADTPADHEQAMSILEGS